jgi:endogenous inhibitor of DNA gyrase (YacG/DUF329 family)
MAQSKTTPKCPICKKPPVSQFSPFCSDRCKTIDLGHWLKGTYVVPGSDGSAEIEEQKKLDDDEDDQA